MANTRRVTARKGAGAKPAAKARVAAKATPSVAAKAKPKAKVAAKAKPKAMPAAKAKVAAKATARPAAKAKVFVSKHPPKQRSAETLALIDRLRAICLALPDATEQVAWAEPTWRIGGKIFAMCDTYHHGSGHLSVHIPAPVGAQEALIDADPARFFRPPYTGHNGWVAIVLDTEPEWEMVASLVGTAYELIAAKRKRTRA